MKTARSAPVTNRSYEERAIVSEIRICFSYTHTDAPLDGSNNFTRALREHVSQAGFYYRR